ncbi:MAG: hypothetical protein E7302_16900 [Butyrivibrio sp.]|nr:hypothetical protein [Butyrivibrio sp.]
MKKFKNSRPYSLLALCIGLMLALSLSVYVGRGFTSFASESPDDFELNSNSVVYQVNPLYSGIITEADLKKADNVDISPAVVLGSDKCGTTEEMANALRTEMVQRTETIRVYYSLAGTYTAKQLVDIESEVFKMATEHTGVGNEGDYLKWGYTGVGMQVSYGAKDGNTIGTFSYFVSYYTTAAQEAAVTNKVNQIKSNLALSSKGEYEKVQAVYKYVCDNVKYNYGSSLIKYTCYAAAVNNSAVCQGYSLLIYRLLNESGIDCRMIAGNTSSGAHGWNIIRIGSVYYNADATWDAGMKPTNYRYFLVSDSELKGRRRWNEYLEDSFTSRYPMSTSSYASQKVDSEVKSLKFAKDKLTLKEGKQVTLKIKVSPKSALKSLKFVSSNSKVATVDEDGVVIAKKVGVCVITVSTEDGKTSDKCYVTVKAGKLVAVKSVKLNKKKLSLKVGKTYKLKATVNPKGATDKTVTYKSSDKKVATVDKNGKVKAKKKGKCTITVTTKDGKKTAKCVVTVK